MIRAIYRNIRRLKLRIHSFFQLRYVKQNGRNNVFGSIVIINPKNIEIGSDCSFNHGTYINATNPIKIGNDVTISAGAKIISTGIDYINWAKGQKQHTVGKGIVIGDHVWIGANAQILDEVTISGKYVVVAANAIVTKNITEDYVVVCGCPARIIKTYSKYIIE